MQGPDSACLTKWLAGSRRAPLLCPALQAQTGETVVLGVNEISSALRRQYGNDMVPEHLGDVLRWATVPCLVSLAGLLCFTLRAGRRLLGAVHTLALPPPPVHCSELGDDAMAFLEPHGHGPGGEQFVMNIPQARQLPVAAGAGCSGGHSPGTAGRAG